MQKILWFKALNQLNSEYLQFSFPLAEYSLFFVSLVNQAISLNVLLKFWDTVIFSRQIEQ